MQNLQTSKLHPSPALVNIIDAYWMVENNTNKSVDIPIVPDGCIDIVYKNGEIVLVGLMQVASVKVIKPKDHYFGIRFKPGVIASLLNTDVSQFNDKIIPLKTIDNTLHNNLEDTAANVDKLNVLFEKLFEEISFDNRILKAVYQISSNDGNISMDLLCQKVHLGKKQLERLFAYHVGVTPKKFARFIRFFHTHKYLTKEGISNLCGKVLEKGYYDQAHFNREYKTLTGLNPTSEVMSIFYNLSTPIRNDTTRSTSSKPTVL